MKRRYVFLWILLAVLLFTACDIDSYAGKRPTDQPGTVWTCQEPYLQFKVNDNGVGEGFMIYQDERIPFSLLWGSGTRGISFLPLEPSDDGSYALFGGEWYWDKDCFVVKVTLDSNDFWGTDQTLVFVQDQLSTSTSSTTAR